MVDFRWVIYDWLAYTGCCPYAVDFVGVFDIVLICNRD